VKSYRETQLVFVHPQILNSFKLGSSTRSFTHDASVSVSLDPNVCRKRDFEIPIETIFDPSPLQKVDSTISISDKNKPRIVIQKKTSPWKPKLPKPQRLHVNGWPLRKSWSKNLPTVSRFQSYQIKTTSRWYLNHPVEKYMRNLDPSSRKNRGNMFSKKNLEKNLTETQSIPASSKGCCLNLKGWFIGTPNIIHETHPLEDPGSFQGFDSTGVIHL